MKECILTIDLGTTACKVALFTPNGDVLETVSVNYPTWRPDSLRAEQYPQDWWEATSRGVRLALSKLPPVHVQAIALSSQRETTLPVDRNFHPLHPAIVWMDTRGVEFLQGWRELFPDLQKWTGMIPWATFLAGKVKWLQHAHPDLMAKTAYFLQPKDFLLQKMAGVLATDESLASRTMLFNIKERRWQQELLDDCGIAAHQLPPVFPSSTIAGELCAEVAKEWGLSAGIPIILGGGDRACEALGSGIQQGEVMESTGTTSNISCPVQELPEQLSPRVICSLHVVENQILLEQGMSTTGAIVDWWRGLLNQDTTFDELESDMQRTKPGAKGLLVLPFFMGARAPRWNPNAHGAILGLTLAHQACDISRAILEGIGFELRYAIQCFEEMGLPIHRIRLIGGGSHLKSWNQTKANIYQKHLAVPKIVHAASFGAFLLAAKKIGWISSYEEGQKMNPMQAIYHPERQHVELYNEGYQLYTHLNEQLQGTWSQFRKYRNLNSISINNIV